MQLLMGAPVTSMIINDLKNKMESVIKNKQRAPHLYVILVGNNGASTTYVNKKMKSCEEVGFQSSIQHYEENIDQETLLNFIETLNQDTSVDGILVQLPLPAHINQEAVINAINPDKDVDGFHPVNMGKLISGNDGFIPATPLGIVKMLQHYGISVAGKRVVIIGRSQIVGRPLSILLSSNHSFGNATVTVCHSGTLHLKELCLQADILVAAIGIPEFIKKDMIKEGAIVIDVGITRINNDTKKSGFTIKGDVDFDSCSTKASFITPVPGGVGLTTIGALLSNTWKAYHQGK